MPEPRTITIRLGTLLALMSLAAGLVGGYLVRRDIQVVTQSNLVTDVSQLKMESERTNAYIRSLHLWAVRVSVRNGWPEPPAPERMLGEAGMSFVPEARADEGGS